MKRAAGLAGGCVAALSFGAAAAILSALARSDPGTATQGRPCALPPAGLAVRLFFTGDTRGYIAPCGCSEGLFGGLPRRATVLASARRAGDLLIDLGNIVVGQRPHERLKANYVLDGLKRLEYDFLVPGEGELALGADFERVAIAMDRPKVVCANLTRSSDGARVYDSWAIREVAGGTRLAVVGLTSQFQPLPTCYRVAPPAEALRAALAELKGRADAVIAVSYIEGKTALDLAAEFPGVALVAGSLVPKGSPDLLRRGGAPVMLLGELGQHLAWVGLDASMKPVASALAWLGDGVADEPGLAALVKDHDEQASKLGDAFAADRLAGFRREGRVGSAACKECHEEEYRVWAASKHAHAMESLRGKGQHENPNCMQCHLHDVMGEPDDSRAGIGCESCHGSGAAHTASVGSGRQGVPVRAFMSGQSERCATCHDEANSPRFVQTEYWSRIAHGVPRAGGKSG